MEAQQINWWLELVRIGVPVLATVIVGWLIARSNETYKSKLARDAYRYQDFYPKMTSTIAGLYKHLSLTERSLELTYGFANNDLFKQNPDFQTSGLEEHSSNAIKLAVSLEEHYDGVKILLDENSSRIFDEIIRDVGQAAKFIRALSSTDSVRIREGDDIRMWSDIDEILNERFPKLKKKLESHIHSITQT